jgi:hypothetical protein
MDNLTFDIAVKTAISMELSEKDAKQLNGGNQTVNYIDPRNKRKNDVQKQFRSKNNTVQERNKSNYNSNGSRENNKFLQISCYRCGGPHLSPKCNLSKNIKCDFCGLTGHVKRVCFKRIKNDKQASAHQVDNEEINQLDHMHFRNKYVITLLLNGVKVKFELDTGSAVTIMSKSQFINMFPSALIESTHTKLQSYCNHQIEILGVVQVLVKYKNPNYNLNIYLTNTNKMPLLGREWIRQLNISEMVQDLNTTSLHTLIEEPDKVIKSLLEKYRTITEKKLSKIEGIQAKLTLNRIVTQFSLKRGRSLSN